ncbi:hypothetical protein DFR60_10911 [Hungatella effluvii]|uniref:Transglutaminase superfamily protein n=1 Tax=Hungatella effluvii TaxID=1096246 RepID=A0A2V3Y110_9FIRM|nr:hypothetical protein [Hungatella effluvii]PXX51610.1 hypothetical protein DFR60_10911 [Hungatella effluvii]
MKKLLGMLLTVAMCVTMATPAFASNDMFVYSKEADGWYMNGAKIDSAETVYALNLGEQFRDIADEKERIKAVADYIKNSYEWDLQFDAIFKVIGKDKTRHFDKLYTCMLEGAGINVVGHTMTAYINRTFDNTCQTAQDVVIELGGQRYWSSALMYKYHGDEYLLVDHIPSTDHTNADVHDYDMDGNFVYEELIMIPEEDVIYGNVLTD